MNPRSPFARSICALLPGLFLATPSPAASLQPVSDWGASGVPSTVSMYQYVPDHLPQNPPILVLVHFCGGSAAAVFGQAQGGGIVAAADEYGFIMVVPQAANADGSGRCWDVGSSKALTRDGGGDTQAIAQMVAYALREHGANPDRVYVTGDSSGGMMTEALLALYPDVFKAGSAFAGVPAGCWAVSNPDGGWSAPCAGGAVVHTPEEWGAIVEAMYPGYTGPRPRVQLFHGDADDTIDYANHTEAIDEWTAVLGLSLTPTSTDTVQLGTHQATRQRWENACGYVVLDAFTSLGGDHGPSDAIFDADYVIPFLGLDQVGPTDPEVAECSGGTGGLPTGGASSSGAGGESGLATGGATGGSTTGGGTGDRGSGGAPTGGMTTGGMTTGGVTAGGTTTGGAPESGGVPPAGGAATGGSSGSGGALDTGGSPATGGVPGTGGATGTGGASGSSGSAIGGTAPAGGAPTTGGVPTSGGATGTGGVFADSTDTGAAANDSGCGCRVAGRRMGSDAAGLLGLIALLVLHPMRRRPRTARPQ